MQLSFPENSVLMKEMAAILIDGMEYRCRIKIGGYKNLERDMDIIQGIAFHGMSAKELSNEYGISTNTVYVVYNRYMKYLAKVLED